LEKKENPRQMPRIFLFPKRRLDLNSPFKIFASVGA